MSKRNYFKIKEYGTRQNKFGKTEVWGYIIDYRATKDESYGEYFLFWGQPDSVLQFKSVESTRHWMNWWQTHLMRRRRTEKARLYSFFTDPHKDIPRKNKLKLMRDFREFLVFYKLKTNTIANDY